MPSGYRAPVTSVSAGEVNFPQNIPTSGRGPRYTQDAAWDPQSWNPNEVRDLQYMLYGSGYLSDNFRPGYYDRTTRNAYRTLLGEANGAGETWQQTLARRMRTQALYGAGPSGGRAGTVLPGFTPTLSNPDDLKAIAKGVAREVIGKDVSPEDLDRFVSAYQGLERTAQRTEYDLQVGAAMTEAPSGGVATGPSGDVVKPPDPQVAAEAAIRYAMPGEAQMHDAAGVYGRLLSLMGMGG